MNILRTIMTYLREQQTPVVRVLHITVLLLVLSQILVSNFMGFEKTGEISKDIVEFYGTWTHIITGLFIIPIAVIFVIVGLKNRGLQYYFPYLYGKTAQLKADIGQITKLKLPETSEYGIAGIIQGLGLGALLLVLFSGMAWFLSWYFGAAWAKDIKEVHELFTGLIQAYIVGHGSMGILHIFFREKLQNSR